MVGERRLDASAILYVGTRRWLEFALPLAFAGADEGVSPASASDSLGVFGWLEPACVDADRGVSAAILSCSVFETVSFDISLVFGISMIESDLRCCRGVGVSGVVGDVGLDAVGVVSSPFVHAPCFMIRGEGEPVVSEALAIKSSDEPAVCEKSVGGISVPKGEMPKPSIFAAAAVSCRSMLSGSVAVADGTSKSSCDSVVFPFCCAPLSTRPSALDADAGPFHSGCGSLPMMFSRPVPARAHSQIPRRGGD